MTNYMLYISPNDNEQIIFVLKPLPPTAQNAMVWAVTLRIFSYLTWLALSHLDCKGKP